MTTPRAYTADEVRDMLLQHSVDLARYWATTPGVNTVEERCEGVVFSMLVMLDGGTGDLPGFTLTPTPHEDDKAYCISQGENWFEPVVINDVLHEHLHRFVK